MRKVFRVLAVAALALGLLLPTHQALADDAADLEAVERELEAEATALALYKSARERAQKAVEASSLAEEYKRLSDARNKVWDVYERLSAEAEQVRDKADKAWKLAHKAEDEARRESIGTPTRVGEDAIEASMRAMREWRASDQTRLIATSLSQEYSALISETGELLQKYLVASDKARAQSERMSAMIDSMTVKFLTDEIARAIEQELGDLERELRELEKKARKGVTI